MVKILHVADIHLGMENYGKTDKSGINSRLLDFLKNLDYAVDYAIKNKVEFFLFSGDAFKTREPTQTQQREFAKRIKKLSQHNIQVVLAIGNHDLPNASGKADSLEIYKTLEVQNVYIAKDPQVITFRKMGEKNWLVANDVKIPGFANECFQVAILPWVSKSSLTGKEEFKNKTIDEANQLVAEKINLIIDNLANQIDTNYSSVLVAHATVAGAEFGAERKVYVGSDIVVPLNKLTHPWKYVALGHLHKYQVLSTDPPILYSGSIDRVDFSEEKEDKGFVVAEIDKNKTTIFKFIKAPAREFVTIKINLEEDCLEPMDKILQTINKTEIKDKVVKVVINLPENIVDLINNQQILEALKDCYYVASINKEVIKEEIKARENLPDVESFTPVVALEKYLSTHGISDKKKRDYLHYAENLIKEIQG